MSMPRKISPMLDGFLLGEACFCHEAVQCFPAIERRSGDKYIVKVISVPLSRVQMDALLLTGAFTSKQAANNYFKEEARELLQEAKTLRHLTTIGGFIDYDCFQVVPGVDDYGFEVYLLSPYRTSLQEIFENEGLTHQGIMNLALDMANALSACRNAGFLYLNLKPSNVFRTERGFRIGDLGFVTMSGPNQPRLPDQYRGAHTPPELLADPTAVNETGDVYQLGLLLYQAYNGGVLPGKSDLVGSLYAPPRYADYEMAEIILRACAPDPSVRYMDPGEMAEALVQYAQRNGVPDGPVIPPVLKNTSEESGSEALSPDETAPSEENTSDLQGAAVTAETSHILSRADALIDHPVPAPPAAPKSVSKPKAEPPRRPAQSSPKKMKAASPPPKKRTASQPKRRRRRRPLSPAARRRVGYWVIGLLVAILLIELCVGIWISNRRSHSHDVDNLSITGTSDSISVTISTDAEDQLLWVLCTDGFGNTQRSSVTDGTALFENLQPGTYYRITVETDKGHTLTGATSASFTTARRRQVLRFDAAAGTASGSVLLSITTADGYDGPWVIAYSAPGAEGKTVTFTGKSTTIRNLTPGSTYSFTLSAADGQQLAGQTVLSFPVS